MLIFFVYYIIMVKQNGGEGDSFRKMGEPVIPGIPTPTTQVGGRRRRGSRRRASRRRASRSQSGGKRRTRRGTRRGGDGGIVSTAALPFGLLALQRYFKGSKSSKRNVHNMGNTFKRTLRGKY